MNKLFKFIHKPDWDENQDTIGFNLLRLHIYNIGFLWQQNGWMVRAVKRAHPPGHPEDVFDDIPVTLMPTFYIELYV